MIAKHNMGTENILSFVNRTKEFKELNNLVKTNGLIVLFGRRRVGKTSLLIHFLNLRKEKTLYSQAIEGVSPVQLNHIFNDIKNELDTNIIPKNWNELFEIIDNQRNKVILCIDEFPYLVSSDPTLPSVFQKWIDHSKKKDKVIILSGSSNKMMHNTFLNASSPLYGRALKVIKIEPMSYMDFCKAKKIDATSPDSFEKFSLVGGIPKYWEFVSKTKSVLQTAEELYFSFAPYMQFEPRRILSDELLDDLNPLSVLEIIGRGAEKPSEIAARMERKQTDLSRVFQQMIDANIITRVVPFGELSKNNKKTLYKITDASIRFWYKIYSANRTNWHGYSKQKKLDFIHQHSSTIFEDYFLKQHNTAQRYWEDTLEIDAIRIEEKNKKKRITVSELKWKKLTLGEKNDILFQMQHKWQKSKLSLKYNDCEIIFEVIDINYLKIHENK